MYHFEKKISKIFFPEEPRENVGGPARMFPRPRCGSRRACLLHIWKPTVLSKKMRRSVH